MVLSMVKILVITLLSPDVFTGCSTQDRVGGIPTCSLTLHNSLPLHTIAMTYPSHTCSKGDRQGVQLEDREVDRPLQHLCKDTNTQE